MVGIGNRKKKERIFGNGSSISCRWHHKTCTLRLQLQRNTIYTNTLTCIHSCRSWSSSSSSTPTATPTTSSRHCEFFGRFSQVALYISLSLSFSYTISFLTQHTKLLFYFILHFGFDFLFLRVRVNAREPSWEL